jgi:hypothetical protein
MHGELVVAVGLISHRGHPVAGKARHRFPQRIDLLAQTEIHARRKHLSLPLLSDQPRHQADIDRFDLIKRQPAVVTVPGGHAVEHGDDRHGGHLRVDDVERTIRGPTFQNRIGHTFILAPEPLDLVEVLAFEISQLHVGDEHLA